MLPSLPFLIVRRGSASLFLLAVAGFSINTGVPQKLRLYVMWLVLLALAGCYLTAVLEWRRIYAERIR